MHECKMPSCLEIFFLFISIHGVASGPLPRYSNATRSSAPSTSTISSSLPPYSRHEHSVADLSLDVVPTSSTIAAYNAGQTSSEAITPALPVASTTSNVPIGTTTSRKAIFSYAPARHNSSQTSAGTTTLTLWTTLPYAQSNQETRSSTQSNSDGHMSSSSRLSSALPHHPMNVTATTMYGGRGGPKATTTEQSSSKGLATTSETLTSNNFPTSTATATTPDSQATAAPSDSNGESSQSTFPSASSRSTADPFPTSYTFDTSGAPNSQSTMSRTTSPGQSGATATVEPVPNTYTSTSSDRRGPGDSHPTPTFSLPEIVTQRPPQGGPEGNPTSAGIPGITIVPVDPNKVTVTVTVSVPSWTTTMAGQTVTVTA